MTQIRSGIVALMAFAVYLADLVLGAYAEVSFLPLLWEVGSLFIACLFFVLMVLLAEQKRKAENLAGD
ncbi:MAG: hypothetical protein ACPGO7_02515 [Alphaproteobacteria bacterium]